ncbi:uncharacterized protein LOC126298094 isoform X1 [Schistocerca gregaria]|uniref:uncharacterized protein LOC126298094 isoform X1 n=2 Tax=Schistocerca gregaria TaxID=7010 RepID=UPI00211E5779|nr:uncharacterized protein LOC126298094 isoform X1 [Schistocerca gregaria]
MNDDSEMETNILVDGAAARYDSNLDVGTYSLLPDIIWPHTTDISASDFGKVVFRNVKDRYPPNDDLLCMYSVESGIEVRDDDRVAIFTAGCLKPEEEVTWVPAAKHPWANEVSVVFPACQLPPRDRFYQFCYINAGKICGASLPFSFQKEVNVNAEDQHTALYLRNNSSVGASAQISIVSTGGDCQVTVSADYPQNLTLSSNEGRNNVIHLVPKNSTEYPQNLSLNSNEGRNNATHLGTQRTAEYPQNLTVASNEGRTNVTHLGHTSDEPLQTNTAETEVTSSEQTAPLSLNKKQKNTSGVSLKSMYKDYNTPAVASTSQGADSAEIGVPSFVYIPSGSNDSGNDQNIAQSANINNDGRGRFISLENEKRMLVSTMNTVSEYLQENANLRAHLNCEVNKNRSLMENLRRLEAEVERQVHQYDIARQNNSVAIAELENELDNCKRRIAELYSIISDKEMTIAYLCQSFGGVNERDFAFGAPSQFPSYPGYTDGQLQQEGHVGIGASRGMQRQDIRTPFYAALRKTRNYYVTFLSDKAEIERKVFALTWGKLLQMKKLHSLKDRKESLMRLEYEYYTALQNTLEAQNGETRRILMAISKVTAERRALDQKAFMEADMIDEIKRRLEINRQNTITLRAKAIEVFTKFIDSYNYSTEHYSEAVQTEVRNGLALYMRLDKRFHDILLAIANCSNNMYLWEYWE